MSMSTLGFDILYEDGPCLAVCKPGGVLTQAPPGIDSLEVRVRDYLRQRDGQPGKIYLGVPHRIDRPASGALVLAKHARAARRLAEQFEFRTIDKRYLALMSGCLPEENGTWSDWLRKIPDVARAEVCEEKAAGSKLAVLHFQVLARFNDTTLVGIQLETGRTHQIRIQAASRGFPLLGDTFYGAAATFGPKTEDPRGQWIALHAERLKFRHPMTREKVTVIAPLPSCWQTYRQQAAWPAD